MKPIHYTITAVLGGHLRLGRDGYPHATHDLHGELVKAGYKPGDEVVIVPAANARALMAPTAASEESPKPSPVGAVTAASVFPPNPPPPSEPAKPAPLPDAYARAVATPLGSGATQDGIAEEGPRYTVNTSIPPATVRCRTCRDTRTVYVGGGVPEGLEECPDCKPAPVTRAEAIDPSIGYCEMCEVTRTGVVVCAVLPKGTVAHLCAECRNGSRSKPLASPPDEGRSEAATVPTVDKAAKRAAFFAWAKRVGSPSTGILATATAHPRTLDCPIPGCYECSVRDCPSGEPLHYDKDGCPACNGNEEEAAPVPQPHADDLAQHLWARRLTVPQTGTVPTIDDVHAEAVRIFSVPQPPTVAPRVLASVEGVVRIIGKSGRCLLAYDEYPLIVGAVEGQRVTIQVLPATGEEAK